ncbi:hypothetical protein [Mangrovibacterium lignilyticum]|nr:hypothetical protein [Mangrovibacterium lignilyticum]
MEKIHAAKHIGLRFMTLSEITYQQQAINDSFPLQTCLRNDLSTV